MVPSEYAGAGDLVIKYVAKKATTAPMTTPQRAHPRKPFLLDVPLKSPEVVDEPEVSVIDGSNIELPFYEVTEALNAGLFGWFGSQTLVIGLLDRTKFSVGMNCIFLFTRSVAS